MKFGSSGSAAGMPDLVQDWKQGETARLELFKVPKYTTPSLNYSGIDFLHSDCKYETAKTNLWPEYKKQQCIASNVLKSTR